MEAARLKAKHAISYADARSAWQRRFGSAPRWSPAIRSYGRSEIAAK